MNNEFTTKISYEQLRQIIFDYFKEEENIGLSSISIDYLRDQLTGYNANNTKFFIMKNELGESRFNIPKSDIEKILKYYLLKRNFEFVNVQYDYSVVITYKIKLKLADETKERHPENDDSIMKL